MTALLAIWGVISRFMALLGIPKWLPLAGIAGLLTLTGAYWKGHWDAAQNCREAELRAKIASLERDITAEKDARSFEAAQVLELEAQRQQLAKEVADYEAALSVRPEPNCALTDDDIDRLSGKRRR